MAIDDIVTRIAADAEGEAGALLAEAKADAERLAAEAHLRADAARLRDTLPAALATAGVELPIDEAPADIEHGVVLLGDRLRVEVSAAAIVASRRDALLAEVDAQLFGEGE